MAALVAFLAWSLLCAIVGGLVYRTVWGGEVVPVTEGHASVINLDDSVVLQRSPVSESRIAAPRIPAGHTRTRTAEVDVLPPPVECPDGTRVDCPVVGVRIDLLRAPDQTYRVQVSSDNGEVLGGVDIPREPILIRKERPWAVGLEKTSDGKEGAFLSRDFGRIQTGLSVTEDEARVRIGWRF